LKIGFLGHNGFALGDQEAPVLVDPILYRRYGEEYTSSPVEVYPPRWIDHGMMPNPAAVIISHEHSDHFHLPSLNLLAKSTPIIVGPMMIDTVVECIERLGLTVTRLPFGEPMRLGSTIITLYAPGANTVLWESRVSQVHAVDVADQDSESIFLAIDAEVSEDFLEGVRSGSVKVPRLLALSNNAQVTPPGVYGSLDCYRPKGEAALRHRGDGFPGLDILEGIVDYTANGSSLLRGAHILLCGGGFLKDYEQMGPFPFSEQQKMAELARKMVRHIDVNGPLPGDIVESGSAGIDKVGTLSWLGTDDDRFTELVDRREGFLRRREAIPLRCVANATPASEELAFQGIEKELDYISRVFLLSPLGREMTLSGTPYPFSVRRS
jgi:hypothetical protein